MNSESTLIERSSYWSPDLVQPAGRPQPWPRPPGDRCRRLQSGPACSGSSKPTRTVSSGPGSQNSPAAGETGRQTGTHLNINAKYLLIDLISKFLQFLKTWVVVTWNLLTWNKINVHETQPLNDTHLYTGEGGVLVRFNDSVVGLDVHQSQQEVLPPSPLQNL